MARFASYELRGRPGFGLVTGPGVVALAERLPGAATLQDLLTTQTDLRRIEDRFGGEDPDYGLEQVQLLPPILAPQKIICVGLNYHGHVAETGRRPVGHPTLFSRWSDSHVGHGVPLVLPTVSDRFDYEGELAVIIGRQGRHIPRSEAMAHVAGYSCYNDGSLRDWQRHSSQFLAGKNFIASGAFGPWLVTADAVPDYRALQLTTRLNGAVMQQACLADLMYDIPALIAYVSGFTVLSPGDVLVTGTPDGVGAFRDPPVWMAEGDLVEIDIPGIGLLTNPVVAEVRAIATTG